MTVTRRPGPEEAVSAAPRLPDIERTTRRSLSSWAKASIDRVWELTQDNAHPRWDLRFSRITPIEKLDNGGYPPLTDG